MMRQGLLLLAGLAVASAAPPQAPVALDLITGETLPQRLSDYRFFTNRSATRPNARVVGYGLNTPLFSDYSVKARFLYVPPGTKARHTASGALDFPVGSALIKTFAFPADLREPDRALRVIETRVLLHRPRGWVALPYIWNADRSEAVLARGGGRVDVAWLGGDGQRQEISYRIPNSNQCKECHARAGAIEPIGPKTRNLDDGAQLGRLAATSVVAPAAGKTPRLPRWDDAKVPVAQRARAYLDVNCGHCHNPAGAASNSGLYLTWDEAEATAPGLFKRPVAAGRGSGGHEFVIEPGHPERSILLYRMQSTEPGVAMPEQGRATVHREAVALLGRWIAAMPARP
jgi:uncharacterized repeat protein (TIGR03806 family)